MTDYSYEELIVQSQVDGPALTNTTTPTSLLPGAAKLQLPSGFFNKIGKKLRIKGAGRLSTVVTSAGNLTLDVRLNSTPIVVFNGGAIALSTAANTNATFRFEIELRILTLGSGTGATLIGTGELKSAALASPVTLIPATAPAAGTGFDSTAANLLDLFGTFSAASASNSLTLHDYAVEALN